MSHTVPYDIHEQNKTIANAVNSAFRHCRIGKVRLRNKRYENLQVPRYGVYNTPEAILRELCG